ncbi:PD40 domain-containing protein [Ktedonobacter racemifer]|uniref:WD40 domain protein beta Propeller n=1 Tax=Ktedonobacter racemifer DSM 44963 TaxID=485913 RepID=D6TZH5_KTERA|nr:PD40 domain-containing protein [Ktedonobacter racemifer]EFH81965.1 hypothetical protein Krac_2733 [Ktedonobacter racemifer DSM 44963]
MTSRHSCHHFKILYSAQVSGDGQWIFFATQSANAQYGNITGVAADGEVKLKAIRMDGKGLQTLYCGKNIGNFVWSPDGRQVAFFQTDGNSPQTAIANPGSPAATGGIYVLNTDNTSIHVTYTYKFDSNNISSSNDNYYSPLFWADSTRLAVIQNEVAFASPVPPHNVYLLDTTQQQIAQDNRQPRQIVDERSLFCWSYALAPDMQTLYHSQCPDTQGGIISPGVSLLVAHPFKGGSPETVLKEAYPPFPSLLIGQIIAVTDTSIVFEAAQATGLSQGNMVKSSPTGTWRVNRDGTGLKEILPRQSSAYYLQASLPTETMPWDRVSRDSRWFVSTVGTLSSDGTMTTQTLQIMSTQDGSTVHKLATYQQINTTQAPLGIIGWTRI